MQGEKDEDDVVDRAGIAFWATRVVRECEQATSSLNPEHIHDLRVALRRCRSIAGEFKRFDPSRDWIEIRKESARLFRQLGELRDTQVMMEWLKTPGAPQDDVSGILLQYLSGREEELREVAAGALDSFDRKKWVVLATGLSKRAHLVPSEGAAFRHLALELWHNAFLLHRQALRNRTHIGFHRLRIGLKKFRYIVENFLPSTHEEWSADLRNIQDLLGEMHDLHVLLQKAIEIGAIHDRESRYRWRSWIEGESNQRLDRYRQKMSGKDSLWRIWRNRLPQGEQLKTDCIERLKTWAHFRDSDSGHSGRVAQTALQIHEGLVAQNLLDSAAAARSRDILHIAALLHAVGAAGRGKNRHKRSFRILCKLRPPIGLEPTDFRIAAFVVRYHRGALPTPVRKRFPDLSEEDTKLAIVLAGILRFAVTCTASRQMEIFGLEMTGAGQKLLIRAKGYDAYSSLAQKLARARHLLEIACGLPIIIQSWQSSK